MDHAKTEEEAVESQNQKEESKLEGNRTASRVLS